MTRQEETELLLRVMTRLAQTQLEKGGFIPFGGVLGSKRDVQLVMPKGWKQNSTRDEVEGYWTRELKKYALQDGCRVVCFCADVRVPKDDDQLVPGLLIHIEHVEAESEDMLYPYHKEDDAKVVFGKPTSVARQHMVLTGPSEPPHG